MSIDRPTLSRFITQCDPKEPLSGDSPYYIPFDRDPSVRGEEACIDTLRRVILNAEQDASCQLFTGFPGTGKTTELRRLARRFHEAPPPDGAYVLFVDCEEYINRFFPISIADVLSAITYSVAREADVVEQTAAPPGEAYLEQLFKSIHSTLPSSAHLQPKFELYGVKLMLEFRDNRTIHDEVEQAISKRFQAFVAECFDVIAGSLARIRAKVGSRADRFIIIADGLEKIDALNESQRETIEDSVESLFVAHGEFLRLPCHVIYTFPVWLRFRSAQLGSVFSCEPLTLPMVKVRERGGTAFEPGLDKLYQLVERRLDRVPERVFGADPRTALRPILEASGGYPRDVLRIVRHLLQREDQFPVAPERVERAIRAIRQTYHDIVLGTDEPLLKLIAETHRIPTNDRDRLRQFGQLFSRYLVLAYRNGTEWFDLHPLVRKAPALIDHFGPEAAP